MSGQPFVSALSVCGPAIGKAVSYGDIDEIFGGRDETRYGPQQKAPIRMTEPTTDAALTSKENLFIGNNPTSGPTKAIHTASAPKPITKKPSGTVTQKPPFVVGKAPTRSNPPIQKPQVTPIGNVDNRAEITDLKRQIGELSHLLRLHVDTKVTKRDIGTDPIVFDKATANASTNTDSGNVCSKCKQGIKSSPPPTPLPFVEDSPEHNTSLCSQFESLAMQYLSDDQLADIAHGNQAREIVGRKPSSSSNKNPGQHQRRHPGPVVNKTSPPKRRMAAVATTTESNTISPNYGSNGGVTLTRRRVMTMEQQVSIFGSGSNESTAESLPFGFSVASQEFMQRHGVGRQNASRPAPVRQSQRNYDRDDGYPDYYRRPDHHRYADYQRNHYDASVVRPARRHNHGPQQRQYDDVDAYFEHEWD